MNETPLAPYLSFARRHRWSYLAALLVSVLGTLAYLIASPTLYRATATTIVPYRQVEADLRFGNGRPFPVQYAFVVNNHLAVLRSGSTHRAILQALAREAPDLLEELQAGASGTEEARQEQLLRALQGRLRASSRDKTGLLQLEATASSASRAARLANLSLKTYAVVQDSLNNAALVEWLGKLKEEEQQWARTVAEKEEALRRFRSRERAIDLENEGRAVIHEILRLQGLQVQDTAELESQRARLSERKAQLARIYEDFQQSLSSDAASVAGSLRQQLSLDQARLEYLVASGMATDDPQIEALRARIARAGAVLEEQASTLPSDPSIEGDPVLLAEALLNAIREIEPEIAGRKAQVAELDTAIDSLQQRMVVLPTLASAESRYEQELKLARQIYELVQQRRVEAEMIAHRHGSRLAIIHPAEPPQRPASPRPLLAMVSALLITLLLGTVAAVGVEAVDPTVRDAQDAGRISGWTVLCRPRREGGGVAPEVAAAVVAQRLDTGGAGLWLLDPEGEPLDTLQRAVQNQLAAAEAGVRVGAGDLGALLAESTAKAWVVVVVVHVRRTRRSSLIDTTRLLQQGSNLAGGLLVQ